MKSLNAPEQDVLKLFKCAKESISRAEHLYKNHKNSFNLQNSNPSNSPTCEHNNDKNLQKMLNPKIQDSWPPKEKLNLENVQVAKNPKYQIPKQISPSVTSPTTNVSTPVIPPRTTSKSVPPGTENPNLTKSFPPPISTQKQPIYNTNDIYALENQKLSHMMSNSDKSTFHLQKRYLENLAIQKQLESSYAKFLQEQEKIRKNEELEERRQKAKTFRWRTEDKWSLFIEKKFFYDQRNVLDEDLTWIEAIQNSNVKEDVIQHHMGKLTLSTHPLGQLILTFNSCIIQIYKLDNPYQQINQKDLLNDVNAFIEKIIEILFVKYWKFDSELLANTLVNVIEKTIFLNGLYHKIIAIYQKKHSSDDLRFRQKCEKLKEISLEDLEVDKKFLLTTEVQPYSKVIEMLKKMSYPSSCDEKIDLISKSISQISLCVVDYYKDSKIYKKSDLILGAEDMLPIFIYSLIKTKCSSMYSILMFLIDFMDEDNIKGSDGYCMATLETAVNEILNYEMKNTKDIEKKMMDQPPTRKAPSTPVTNQQDDFFSSVGFDDNFDGYF